MARPSAAPVPGLTTVTSLFAHDELGARFIHALKLDNDRAIVCWLADSLSRSLRVGGVEPRLITWAPTTAKARRERGFDQAELLAKAVARRLGLRARPMLRRVGAATQHGRSRSQRLGGPRFLASAVPAAAALLVVDDVLTTGATLTSAAEALRGAGAAEVHGATCSRA